MEGLRVTREKGELDFQKVQGEFERLFEAIANLLERDWGQRYINVDSARTVFLQSMRIAINTYKTIMYIAADIPKDPLRRPEYSLSLAPLTRTLFEQLVTFIFLIEDIPTYIPWLFKTGYTEQRIQLDHYLKYHSSDPVFQNYIDALRTRIVEFEKEYNLTANEISNPKKFIKRWPTPGGFIEKLRNEHSTSSVIPFLEYIHSWFYRVLSGHTHLNSVGIIERGIYFDPRLAKNHILGSDWEEKLKEMLLGYRIGQVYLTATLMLAICSEIEGHFNYG